MPFYDGIQTSYQLGPDLQNGSPPNVALPEDVPGFEISFFSPVGPTAHGPLSCICEHQGSLFVAFVQSLWDGVTTYASDAESSLARHPLYLAQAPVVKRYDLASNDWLAVGDPIEPSFSPTLDDAFSVSSGYTTYPGAVHHVGSGSFGGGTRFLATRIFLASDGTNLYLAYALHITGTDAVGNTWSPIYLIVRRWTGSTWELYGQIDPVGQQDFQTFSLGPPVSLFGCAYGGISLVASPLDVGAVYATLVQGGLDVQHPSDLHPGNYLYEGVAARFDGGGIGGTVKTVGTPITGTGDGTFTDGTLFQGLEMRYGDSDGPWIFYSALPSRLDFSISKLFMQRWSDMAIVQTLPISGAAGPAPYVFPPPYLPHGYEGGAYLVSMSPGGLPVTAYLRDLPSDGSSLTGPLDGALPELSMPAYPEFAFFLVDFQPEPPENIWVVDSAGDVWLYHRPCRAWTNIKFTAVGAPEPVEAGWPFSEGPDLFFAPGLGYLSLLNPVGDSDYVDFVVVDGTLYVVSWLLQQTGGGFVNEFQLRVYAAPIQRDRYECVTHDVHVWHRSGRTQQ